MCVLIRSSAMVVALLALATPAAASHGDHYRLHDHYRHRGHHGWSYYSWYAPHHDVVHGKPRSIFTDPVGYAYPEIKYRNATSSYAPLPEVTAATPRPQPATPPKRRVPR